METLWRSTRVFVAKLAYLLAAGFIFCMSGGSTMQASNNKLLETHELQQSSNKIKGTIKDKSNNPLIGVSVFLKGTTIGTTTDLDGKFILTTDTQNPTIVVSYIGYKSLTLVANSPVLDIILEEDANIMDEVIVVGYGVMKKSDVTGAISSLKVDEIMRQPVANVAQTLQGQVPGVIVTSNSGAPGGSINVRIRGIGTVNNSDPLYVVDGMPVKNIDYLSSSDIESMEILKDASATAIYGARGANGVVLISTKQGKTGKTMVSLDAYFGTSSILNNLKLLSGPEWYDLQTEINKVKIALNPKLALDLSKVDRNTSTDWMDEITRTATIQSYNLGISGGLNDEYTYNTGVSYIKQEGTIKKTDFERISLRQNVEKTVIKKILNIGTNANISQSNTNKILEGSNTVGIVNSAIKLEPVIPVRNKDGSFGSSPFVDYNNPVADIEYTNNNSKIFSVVGNVYADLSILKHFKFRSSFGVDLRKTDDYEFIPEYFVSSYQNNKVNQVIRGYEKSNYQVLENTLSYINRFNRHSINAVLGYTREWGRVETLKGTKKNVANDDSDLQYLDAAQDASSATAAGGAYESALISYLGRVNYDFDDRYLITASFRRDGSSRFGSGHRYGNFPSFALGWKISNESFFKNLDANWISSLKLRSGWGRIGNQNIDNYMYQNLLSSNIQYSYLFGNGSKEQLYQGIVAVKMGNKDVRWETTESTNIGLDINLLNGRFSLSGDYYYKKTKDMLIVRPIPLNWGFETGPMTNIGDAENKGFEFNVAWRDKIGSVNYNVGFNLSTIKNNVTSIGSGLPITGGLLRNGSATRTEVGGPIGAFYGYKTEGIIQTAEQLAEVRKRQPNAEMGDVIFATKNKDRLLSDADKTIIGNPIPDFIYGINLGLEWKGLDMNMQFGGTSGNDIFNAMRYYTHDLSSGTNKDRKVLNYWRPDNTNTNIPRLTANDPNDNRRISDRYVEDGSYFRLRNIQIGYTFPKSISQKVYMQKLRIYATAQNLFTITNYSGADPEVGQISATEYLSRGVDIGTYPQARTITGGVSITF